ncbi:MAG: hypothetical protein OEZ31_01840 [Nitrospirota bacterium]|nr:hypothetical protein [Nitrospirota bacterium]MDH5767686.1 hypothetical protein [Nitrospirota bacterium]
MGLQKTFFLHLWSFLILLFVPVFLSACQHHIPPEALSLDSESLKLRQIQTRVFQTDDEIKVLIACSSLLQDLGFTIDESETELGVLVGSKDRSALSAGQIVGSIIFGVFTGVPIPWEKNQKMRASVITRTTGDKKKSIAVRVTFQRIVWNTENKVTIREGLTEPKMYQEFFDKLSKALFLEAQEI